MKEEGSAIISQPTRLVWFGDQTHKKPTEGLAIRHYDWLEIIA